MHAPHCWNTASKAWLSALAHTHTHANTQQGTAKGGETRQRACFTTSSILMTRSCRNGCCVLVSNQLSYDSGVVPVVQFGSDHYPYLHICYPVEPIYPTCSRYNLAVSMYVM